MAIENGHSSFTETDREAFSWWSWRPGIKPLYAFLLGGTLALLGLLLSCLGLFLLFFSLWDQHTPLQVVSALVARHEQGPPIALVLQMHAPALPPETTLNVPQDAYHAIVDNTRLQVLYTGHLQVPIALVTAQHRYPLPETASLEAPANALLPLLLGLLLLCYPALLVHWGWRDLLLERLAPEQRRTVNGVVAGKRALTTNLPLAGRRGAGRGRSWYGFALQPASLTGKQKVLILKIGEEQFEQIHQGDQVRVCYSPHLHYVYTIQNAPENAQQ